MLSCCNRGQSKSRTVVHLGHRLQRCRNISVHVVVRLLPPNALGLIIDANGLLPQVGCYFHPLVPSCTPVQETVDAFAADVKPVHFQELRGLQRLLGRTVQRELHRWRVRSRLWTAPGWSGRQGLGRKLRGQVSLATTAVVFAALPTSTAAVAPELCCTRAVGEVGAPFPDTLKPQCGRCSPSRPVPRLCLLIGPALGPAGPTGGRSPAHGLADLSQAACVNAHEDNGVQ